MPNTAEIDFMRDNGDGTCTCSVLFKTDGIEVGRITLTDKAEEIDKRIKVDVKKAFSQLITPVHVDPASHPGLGKKTFDLDAHGNMS